MQKMFTIGVEEEFQIVDPSTRDLRPHVEQMLAAGDEVFNENIKREMIQSMVETVTPICENVEAARKEVVRLRSGLGQLAAQSGLAIVAAGAHPFSHWQSQLITEHDRYKVLEQDLQDVVRSILIFGLHVHVGIPDRDLLVEIMNEARYFLPHLLALSSNSPFWQGRVTGLKSYRTIVWQQFPRTGIPSTFNSWADFEGFVNLLIKTNCIDNGKKIWWDLRPHPYFSTLEFRVCDMPTNVDDAMMLVALFQAIVAKLYQLRKQNVGFRLYDRALIMENKWRAARYGIDGMLIDFGKREEVPMRTLALELLEFVDDVVDELGSREAVSHINTIVKEGTGADRQLEVFRRTGDMNAVVDFLISETLRGTQTATAG
jgi:glutamate---cysteine ligase / carboxylate-amine ligase